MTNDFNVAIFVDPFFLVSVLKILVGVLSGSLGLGWVGGLGII